MNTPSEKDLLTLSAYLDDALSPRARRRLEARLAQEETLRQALAELRWTRQALRAAPRRLAPRRFTLTRQMAGVRPPTPRLALWSQTAAALAVMALAFFSLGDFLPLGGAASLPPAPEMAVAPAIAPTGEEAAPLMAPPAAEAGQEAPQADAAAEAAPPQDKTAAVTPTALPTAVPRVAPTLPPATAPEAADGPSWRWGLLGLAAFFGGLSWWARRRVKRRFYADE